MKQSKKSQHYKNNFDEHLIDDKFIIEYPKLPFADDDKKYRRRKKGLDKNNSILLNYSSSDEEENESFEDDDDMFNLKEMKKYYVDDEDVAKLLNDETNPLYYKFSEYFNIE
jgi:hypothetical protein